MTLYSFTEAIEYPYTYDPSTARLRAHKVANAATKPITGAGKGLLRGGAVGGIGLGALAAAKTKGGIGRKLAAGTIGALGGALVGGAVGTGVGAAAGTAKGADQAINAVATTKRQLVDNDAAQQKKILASRFAKPWQRRQAQARLQRNQLIDTNLRNYKDAVAQTPDAEDRKELRRAYRAVGRHINARHGANMQYT